MNNMTLKDWREKEFLARTANEPDSAGAGNSKSGASTDVAALTAGVVAVVVSMFVAPGPYDFTGLIVAMTLGSVIWGYVWHTARSVRQSWAVSAVCGLMALPIAGYVIEELLKSGDDAPFDISMETSSRVPAWCLGVTWLFVTSGIFVLDRSKWKAKL